MGVREYWEKVEGCEISNFWIQKTGWVFGQGRWNKVVHDVSTSSRFQGLEEVRRLM
jgi:hypothetical protein